MDKKKKVIVDMNWLLNISFNFCTSKNNSLNIQIFTSKSMRGQGKKNEIKQNTNYLTPKLELISIMKQQASKEWKNFVSSKCQ